MQDQPSSIELIGAVENFMRDVAMKQLQGHAAFHARVAANALAIIKRELELGPAQSESEMKRLHALLQSEGTLDELNRELCRRIRHGEIDLESSELVEHLWQTTIDKVAVDQPRYSAYKWAMENRPPPSKEGRSSS